MQIGTQNGKFAPNKHTGIWVVTMMILALLFFNAGCSSVSGIKPGQTGVKTSYADGFEGITWLLAEIDGSPVTPVAGDRRPSITFDALKKQASGFSGCNNFFSDYKLDGSSLQFGPVGATRRFCEGTAGEVEMKFMRVMGKTRSWEIRDGLLILLEGNDVLARFGAEHESRPGPYLDSMTFLSEWFPSGKVTLFHGEHREPAAPGSASAIVVKLTGNKVFGMINGRETGAVVLATDSGGSGVYYDLALLIKDSRDWMNTDTFFLGDRVKVHSIEIQDNDIVVGMTKHGPDDPMCCPTRESEKRFTVKEYKLVPVADGPSENTSPEIVGACWKWVRTIYNNDAKTVPKEPDRYMVLLHSDGKVDVRADCNRGGGTYIKEGSGISIDITHTTRAICPPGSLEDEFLRNLAAVAAFFMKDGDLYLDLKFDTGTMKFTESGKCGD